MIVQNQSRRLVQILRIQNTHQRDRFPELLLSPGGGHDNRLPVSYDSFAALPGIGIGSLRVLRPNPCEKYQYQQFEQIVSPAA